MKTLLEQVTEIDELLNQLQKTESKMRAGQFIDAWRGINGLISHIKNHKNLIIEDNCEK